MIRIGEALALAAKTGEHLNDSYLHRIRGEILLKRDSATATAEEALLTAIAVAREQKARSFELRAALSLAKLYQSTGRAADAHSVLALVTNFRENLMLPLDQWQLDGLLPAHVDAVLRPRRVEHLNAAEAGRGEHRLCLLDSPDRAKPGAAIGERHGHAVHQADAVVERRDRRRRWRI